MHKPESVPGQHMWDSGIETDHFIPASRPNFVLINKKDNLSSSEFS